MRLLLKSILFVSLLCSFAHANIMQVISQYTCYDSNDEILTPNELYITHTIATLHSDFMTTNRPLELKFIPDGQFGSQRQGVVHMYQSVTFMTEKSFGKIGDLRAYITKRVGLINDLRDQSFLYCINKEIEEETSDYDFGKLGRDLKKEIESLVPTPAPQEKSIDNLEDALDYLGDNWEQLTPNQKALAIITALSAPVFSKRVAAIAASARTKLKAKLSAKLKKRTAQKITGKTLFKAATAGVSAFFSSLALSMELKSSSPYKSPYEFYFTDAGVQKLIEFDHYNFDYALKNSPEIEPFIIELARKLEITEK